MPPGEQPSNDNDGPEVLWENTPLGRRVMLGVSLAVIVIIYGSAILWMDAAHWRAFWITLGIGCIGITIAAVWRLVMFGRA